MARPVVIKPRTDILSQSGDLLATASTEGVVIDVDEPPTSGRILVEFPASVQVWLKPEQVWFRDGALGLLRAILQFRSAVLVDADFPFQASKDLIIDNQLTHLASVVDLKTDDGYTIRIQSDANNDLSVTYLFTGTNQ